MHQQNGKPPMRDPQCVIHPDDFEHLCDKIIEAWLSRNNFPHGSVQRMATPSPVDIIVLSANRTRTPESFHKGHGAVESMHKREPFRDSHFIECKFYSKKLSLDVIAKSLLAAIRFAPKSFTLATNTELDAQAIDYKKYVMENVNRGPEDFYVWFPLRDDLKGKYPQLRRYEPEGLEMQVYEVDSIHIYIRDHFLEKEIPVDTPDVICLQPGTKLTFVATIRHPDKPKHTRKLSYLLILENLALSSRLSIPLIPEELPCCKSTLIKGVLSAEDLAPSLLYTEWKLELKSAQFREIHTLTLLPGVSSGARMRNLPDMREGQANALHERWQLSGFPLLCVSGSGGVGKSVLCEKICGKAATQGYSCVELCLSSESDSGFISDLTWAAIGPKMQRVLDGRENIITTFVETLQLAAGEDSFPATQIQALANVLAKGTLDSAPSEVIIGNLARFIVSKSGPIIFYVRDTHLATPEVLTCLRHLIRGFEQAGWGAIKVILEKRDSARSPEFNQSAAGREGQDLWLWCRTYLKRKLLDIPLEALDTEQITSKLRPVFRNKDNGEILSRLAMHCSGNLLVLDSVIETMLDEKLLLRESTPSSRAHRYEYLIPSLPRLAARLQTVSEDDLTIIKERLDVLHHHLLSVEKPWGCHWLGLIAVIDMEVDAELLTVLTGQSKECVVEPTLFFFVGEGFLTRRGNTYFFSHESKKNAIQAWLQSIPASTLWLQDMATCVLVPERFEEGFARGRIRAYLHDTHRAFEAFNAALDLAGENFSRQFRITAEIHRILLKERGPQRYFEFFDNLRRLLWCGQYVLPTEDLITLVEEAITYLNNPDVLRIRDSEYSDKVCRLHHYASWLCITSLDPCRYLHHAFEAAKSASSIHDASKILNRLLMACALTGSAAVGRLAGLAAYVTTRLLAPGLDNDLLSVNLGEFSALIAFSDKEAALRLAYLAHDNPNSSERQHAHDLFILACALTQCDALEKARSALDEAYAAVSKLSMQTFSMGLDICSGVLHARQQAVKQARALFERALSDAAWMGYRKEAAKAEHNLLAALIADKDFTAAERVYASTLKECSRIKFDSRLEGFGDLLDLLSGTIVRLLSTEDAHRNKAPETWASLMKQAGEALALEPIAPSETTGTFFSAILENCRLLHNAWPEHFPAPAELGHPEISFSQNFCPEVNNAIPWKVQVDLTLYLVC